MTWSGDVIDQRRATKGRDVNFDDFQIVLFCLQQQWFQDIVIAMDSLAPRHRIGRPRQHSNAIVALLALCSSLRGSQRLGELYLASPGPWFEFRKVLRRIFPDDPLLTKDIKPPTRSTLRHLRKAIDSEFGEQLHQALEDSALLYAAVTKIGINHDTLLEPSRNAILYGDSVVVKPLSSFTAEDTALNPVTGELQQRRHDPDAETYVTGDNRVVRGNCFAHLSAFTGHPGEHITFGFRPVTKTGDEQEANVAIAMASAVKNRREGFAALAWDKALRGPHIHNVWNLGLQPLIGVYNKTGKTTEIVTLNNPSIKGMKVQTFAYQGAVCIQGLRGDMIKLDPLKLEYHTNKNGTLRTYATFRIPEGSDCDTRLWGETFMQRLNADKLGGRRYGEYVRAIPPQSTRWKNLYGNRSLAESFNSWFKAKLLPNQRARDLGRLRQWVDLVLMTLIRNTTSVMRYLLRTTGSLIAIT